MIELRFTVYGVPIPKGSMKAFMPKNARFPIITHDNKQTRPWQAMVCAAALEARAGSVSTFEGPVWLAIDFYMPKPKSAPKHVVYPIKKPDLDKLVRSLKDGLTSAAIYRDDAQVVFVVTRKRFARGMEDPQGTKGIPRAEVTIKSGGNVSTLNNAAEAGLFDGTF